MILLSIAYLKGFLHISERTWHRLSRLDREF